MYLNAPNTCFITYHDSTINSTRANTTRVTKLETLARDIQTRSLRGITPVGYSGQNAHF